MTAAKTIQVVQPPYKHGKVGGVIRVWDGKGRTLAEYINTEQGWADARTICDSLTYFETSGEIYTEDQKITCLQNALTSLINATRRVILNPVSSQELKRLVDIKNDALETLDHLGVHVELELGK